MRHSDPSDRSDIGLKFIGSVRLDRDSMNFTFQHVAERGVYQAVARLRRLPTKKRRDDGQLKMSAAGFCTLVPGVLCAVVDQIDAVGRQHRKLLLNALEGIQAGICKSVRRLIHFSRFVFHYLYAASSALSLAICSS